MAERREEGMMTEKRETALWQDYINGKAYQDSLGLTDQIPKNVDFYEGRQWPAATDKTRNLPRPVVNIVKMIVRNKKSSVLGAKVKLVFRADRDHDRADKITAFNQFIESEMEMDDLRNRMVEDAVIKGSGFIHFFWDADAKGLQGEYDGGVRAEVIDPLNIFFSNPQEEDEQKQKWILIVSRVDVEAARQMAKNKADVDLIAPDDAESAKYSDEHEQTDSNLCTVLTRYFRKDGEVYYERATKNVVLHDPVAITPQIPDLNRQEAAEPDAPEDELPDPVETEITQVKATLYPIVAYSYERREKSIYGLSEVEGLIPNQKTINFNYAMQSLGVQNFAWGKYVVKAGALKNQSINNEPGQVLIDHYKGGGEGVRKMTEQTISTAGLQISDNLTQATRMVTGSTEVMTGEQASASQSGVAIAQLQSQALKPIAELRDRFWRACQKGGKVIMQFYRLFYEGKTFEIADGDEVHEEQFNGRDYADIDFAINIEAGAGTQFSEALTISLLDQLFQNERIDFSTYIDLYPDTAMPFKGTLKKKIQEQQEAENAQLKMMLQQAQQALQAYEQQYNQALQVIQQQNDITQQASQIISRFNQMQQQSEKLKVEAASKVLEQNDMIEGLEAENAELYGDAEQLARMAAGK